MVLVALPQWPGRPHPYSVSVWARSALAIAAVSSVFPSPFAPTLRTSSQSDRFCQFKVGICGRVTAAAAASAAPSNATSRGHIRRVDIRAA